MEKQSFFIHRDHEVNPLSLNWGKWIISSEVRVQLMYLKSTQFFDCSELDRWSFAEQSARAKENDKIRTL